MKTFALHTSPDIFSTLKCYRAVLTLESGTVCAVIEFTDWAEQDRLAAAGVVFLPPLHDPETQVGPQAAGMIPSQAGVLPSHTSYSAAMRIYKHTQWPPHHPAR